MKITRNNVRIKEIIVRCKGYLKSGDRCQQRLCDIIAGYDTLKKSSPIEIKCRKCGTINIIEIKEKRITVTAELQDSHF